jgi:hypothetical protein
MHFYATTRTHATFRMIVQHKAFRVELSNSQVVVLLKMSLSSCHSRIGEGASNTHLNLTNHLSISYNGKRKQASRREPQTTDIGWQTAGFGTSSTTTTTTASTGPAPNMPPRKEGAGPVVKHPRYGQDNDKPRIKTSVARTNIPLQTLGDSHSNQ